ncbi:type III restriction-modification system endonuclease [Pasteurella testudinis]|uniref:type III restriction-modification system endonuclease n=1 Tax=Pasteurella testudinis TaxID=761 RepID=UPI00405A36F7
MAIKLSILPHQTACLEAVSRVFEEVGFYGGTEIHQNPVFNINDDVIKENIKAIQSGDEDYKAIPRAYRTKRDDGVLGIDIRMETGTGKTYCYTRLMYELNKRYGFYKFILLVPTTPIKEGTRSFIEADYSKQHFSDLYPGRAISLSVLNPQKKTKGRKMFPQAISDFARGTRLEKNRINALLMSSGMLLSKKTMDNDYDQTLFGTFTKPYDTLASTRPIVIIDEPHKFKVENKAYKALIERIKPQCVIRFGATFPENSTTGMKDYNNLIFNLGSCEAFNENLVKGVATQMIAQESLNETKIKLMDTIARPKSCVFRNEKTGSSHTLLVGESLSVIDEEFHGISVESIGKFEDEGIAKGVELSNGQVIAKGDQIYAGIYGSTYQNLMMQKAIKNHIEQERENFFRERKIKTLSLFFIDSVASYRGEESEGKLRLEFQELLMSALEDEINDYNNSENPIYQEYVEYLNASISDISNTNGGYFAEDNSKADEDIQKEVDQILRDKQSLLSFKDDNGNWNTRRFIFSKWTLREGWDNPNVFQIAKLRSSGSEISKLQEVGRGLRLPVDEFGNRVSDEQFYLTYLHDYSEQGFAEDLRNEINSEVTATSSSIKALLPKVAKDRGMEENELFGRLLIGGFVDVEGNINQEKQDDFFVQYPEFRVGVEQGKVIDKTKNQSGTVSIRKERFIEIKELWNKINSKYYLSLDQISDDELFNATLDILNSNIFGQIIATTIEQRLTSRDGSMVIEEGQNDYFVIEEVIPYNEFLTRVQKATSLPIQIFHNALCEYSKEKTIKKSFFNKETLSKFIIAFQDWFEKAFNKRFSYKALNIDAKETALTDLNGEPKETIVQGTVGVIKDDYATVPDKFLYDKVVYDSPKEKESIERSNIDEVVVFGKIPRKSIQVPLYFGGTTSPDFMYVLKKDDELMLNFIVETKGIKKDSSLREEEKLRIQSAKKFFETLTENGINVSFEKQLQSDDIITMIKNVVSGDK